MKRINSIEQTIEPLVSVVVAVYNAEKYLRQCMDSIIRQTLDQIEIICVNDGSTDLSGEILKSYADADGRIIILEKENEGLGAASARNYGMKVAKGRYVIFLDSDDFFEPDMLEKSYEKAEETNADLVIIGGDEYDSAIQKYQKAHSILDLTAAPRGKVFSWRDCPGHIFQLSQGMAWNKLFRRTFLSDSRIEFQRIKYTDDAYFTFSHMMLAKRMAIEEKTLCHYRVNSGNSQTSNVTEYPDSSYVPYLKLKETMEKWGIYQEVEQSFINCAAVFIRYCYDRIDRYDVFCYLHNKLKEDIFKRLGIDKKEESYYYDPLAYKWTRQVMEFTPGELAFAAARAHGGSTTRILREGKHGRA